MKPAEMAASLSLLTSSPAIINLLPNLLAATSDSEKAAFQNAGTATDQQIAGSLDVNQFIRREQRAGVGAPRGEFALVRRQAAQFGAVGGEKFGGVRALGFGGRALEAETMRGKHPRGF